MRDYLKGDCLPLGTNRWLQEWRIGKGLQRSWMSLFVLESLFHSKSFSRFVIFFSADEAERDQVEQRFINWMADVNRTQFFETRFIEHTQDELTESSENNILILRRSRFVLSREIIPYFLQQDHLRLEKDLLSSLWQIIVSRASRMPIGSPLQTWEYFARHRLVPSIYLPPDSSVGKAQLSEAIEAVIRTIAIHRDYNFDDYSLFEGTSELFRGAPTYTPVGVRQRIPVQFDEGRLINQIAQSIQAAW